MKLSRIVVVVSLAGPFLWLFGSILFSEQSFAFRDSAYYYHPLFQWTAGQWGEGRLPLWNPLENCGAPVVADSTSSVFYPGKILFVLPVSFVWRFKLYVLLHIGLAAATAFLVARRWRASPAAAACCAMSYAFGGYVLFQHCNIVFLVSAAWLPWAVLLADRMLVKRRLRSAVGLGVILALMVLGGDPQTAYHAGLVAAVYALFLWRRERRVLKRLGPPPVSWARRLRGWAVSRPMLLATSAIIGGLLAALQILPSIEWSRASQRAMHENPRNVYESVAFVRESNVAAVRRGILGHPRQGTHHEHIYQFSVGPWRIVEFIWPNVSGRMYPINRRWTNVIPGEDRIWTPSLYVGLLPFVLGLTALRIRRGGIRDRWLTWCVILSSIASFGWYGVGWLIQEFQVGVLSADPNAVSIGEPVGGLYWLMVVFLPAYAYFRFPAKLLVVASLGLSLLAARGWDRAMRKPPKSLRLLLTLIAALSAAAWLFLRIAETSWLSWMNNAPGDDIWGPLDAGGALRDLRFTVAASLCLTLVCLCFFWIRRSSDRLFARLVPAGLLLVTAADIGIANRWMIAEVADQHVVDSPAGEFLASRVNSSDARSRVYRGQPDRWLPAQWRWTSSHDRITENYVWQRATLFPRHHLPQRIPSASSVGSIMPMDYLAFLGIASLEGVGRPDGIAEPHPEILNALAVEYLLLPEGFRYPRHLPCEDGLAQPWPADMRVWKNPQRFEPCWIVRNIDWLPRVESNNPLDLTKRTQQVLFPDGTVRDLRHSAVVESEQPPSELVDRPSASSDEVCEIVDESPGQLELRVKLDSPALVVLNDYYYPGWKATRTDPATQATEQLQLLRTNRVMRGVMLAAGEHRVLMEYRPRSFLTGAIISLLAWLLLAGTAIVQAVQSLRGRTRASAATAS